MTIRERLKAFVAYLKISEGAFEIKADLSRGYVSGKSPSIGSEIIQKIHAAFPELNLYWFLVEEGEMTGKAGYDETNQITDMNDSLKDQILQNLLNQVDRLSMENEELRREINRLTGTQSKSNAS